MLISISNKNPSPTNLYFVPLESVLRGYTVYLNNNPMSNSQPIYISLIDYIYIQQGITFLALTVTTQSSPTPNQFLLSSARQCVDYIFRATIHHALISNQFLTGYRDRVYLK